MDHNILDLKSLSDEEAKLALHRYGKNELSIHPHLLFKKILKEFLNPLILLYTTFSIIALMLGNTNEALLILAIISFSLIINIINAIKTIYLNNHIKKKQPLHCDVVRSSILKKMNVNELVPEDIIYLRSGSMIPADCEILYAKNLSADESIISGEPFPVSKFPKIKRHKIKEENTLYYHTFITSGEGYAKILRTGDKTRFGRLVEFKEPLKTHKGLNKAINDLIWQFLIYGTILISLLILFLLIFNNKPFDITLIIFLLSLTISMIPEALPVITSLALNQTRSKLSKKGLFINDMEIFEDLADIDMICSDKTGTLTQNLLEVEDYECEIENDDFEAYLFMSSCSSLDPFDLAIQNYLKQKGFAPINSNPPYENRSFDPFLKTSSRKFSDFSIYKGAPEFVLSKLSFKNNLSLALKVKKRTETGERALSLILDKNNVQKYLGTIFFSDQIKPDAEKTIKLLNEKGLKLKLISGDNMNICSYVALATGLVRSKEDCIEASSLRFDSLKILKQQLEKFNVIARADPIQKYKIIEALQKEHKIAYIGDGINDTPSIKLADVGIVVENSIDIAKYHADVILTEKHLNALVEGIMDSRKIFENTESYLSHALSMNFNNFLSISILLFALQFFPLLPIQILIANLLMDIVAIKFAFDPVSNAEIKKPSKLDINKSIKLALILGSLNTLLDVIFFYLFKHIEPSHLQSLWFITSFVADLFLILSVKNKGLFIKNLPSPTFLFTIALSILIILVIGVFGLPFISISAIPYDLFPVMFITPIIYFIVLEIAKILISMKLSFD